MDILGIGHAMVDIFIFASGTFPLPPPLKAGEAVHLIPDDMDRLIRELPYPEKNTVTGGTAANIVKAASALGAETLFIGTTGTVPSAGGGRERDESAFFFQRGLAEQGVSAHLASADEATGRCLVIHRTEPAADTAIAASPGAARHIRPEQLKAGFALFDKAARSPRLIVIEGMLCGNVPVMERIAAWCGETGTPLAIDLASPFAAKNAAAILSLFQELPLLIFANETEAAVFAKTLGGETMPEEELKKAVFTELTARLTSSERNGYPLMVEKLGAAGARCWRNGSCTFVPAVPADAPLDVTGAGDTFAGAFLTGFLRGYPPEQCLKYGNTAARLVLDLPGTGFAPGAFSGFTADFVRNPQGQ